MALHFRRAASRRTEDIRRLTRLRISSVLPGQVFSANGWLERRQLHEFHSKDYGLNYSLGRCLEVLIAKVAQK